MTSPHHITFDPDDWEEFRRSAYRAVDDAIERISGLREGHVWQPVAEEAREVFRAPMPAAPTPFDTLRARLKRDLYPWAMGASHPRFWGWYMGAGSLSGAFGDFLAVVDGSNSGGGDTSAAMLERQVLGWLADMCGFPQDAGGVLTSSGSMANFIALAVARTAKAGVDVRAEGLSALPAPMVFYCSTETHTATTRALEALGHGTRSLRKVPVNEQLQMDLAQLGPMIAADRAAGLIPTAIIGTACTTNTGSIDDLAGLARICRDEGLWFHIDGCIGAVLRLSKRHAGLIDGIEEADSVALDLHKWLQVPYAVGAVLTRDRQAHRDTFAAHPDYLEIKARGLANGEFLADYTLDLSRGFSALKVWLTIMEQGTDRIGQMIDQTVGLAAHAAARVDAEPELELLAPVPINIACFRYRQDGLDEATLDAVNVEVMLRVQESGLAMLSDTKIRGRTGLRMAICNHRTRAEDVDMVLAAVIAHGRAIVAEGVA